MSELNNDDSDSNKKTKGNFSNGSHQSLNQIRKETKDYFKQLTVTKNQEPKPSVSIKIEVKTTLYQGQNGKSQVKYHG